MFSTSLLCTAGGDLTTISHKDCGEEIGAIKSGVIQKLKDDAGDLNTISVASSTLLATWTPLLTGVTGTKIQVLPILNNVSSEGGDKIEYGGGDETSGGIPIIMQNAEPTSINGELIRRKSETITTLRSYNGLEGLGIYLFNEEGEMWGIADDIATPTTIYPIPLYSFFVGSKVIGNRSNPDKNMISWAFLDGWQDNLYGFQPAFDVVADLIVTV